MSGRKLLFLATEDWFVKSHFAPLVARAKADGFEVVVAARSSGSDVGARVIEMPFARGSLSLAELFREVRAFRAVLKAEQPDIVHALSLKPVVNCLIGAGGTPQALAVTGLGYFAVSRKLSLRLIRSLLALGIRRAVSAGRAVLVVENEFDRRWVEGGRPLSDDRVFLMPGAGVDPGAFPMAPEPPGPIVVGVVTRLVRSKGVDLAVEAVRRLRSSGLDVRLRIAGAADPKNPESVGAEDLESWQADPGIEMVGAISDVAAFWAGAHIACLPSRGGEGLPRSLLEAASCGRPIVTADVPGCGAFVRDGVTGFVTAVDDVDAIAARLRDLIQDRDMRRRMGEAARALVVNSYTEQHAADVASRAWGALLRA